MKTTSLIMVAIGLVVCTWSNLSEAEREKRFAWINPDTPSILGIIVGLPLGAVIPVPTFLDKKLNKKTGRNLDDYDIQDVSLYEDQWPDELFWDPAYEMQLSRLTSYFAHLQIPSLFCQEKLICEVAAEPEIFSVISDLFMKEIRPIHGPVKMTHDSLMWRYMSAARDGFTGSLEDCHELYPSCHLAANTTLNMPVLKVWRYITTQFNIKLL